MLGYFKFKECGKNMFISFFNEKEFKQYSKILNFHKKEYTYRFYNDKELFYKEYEELLNANK